MKPGDKCILGRHEVLKLYDEYGNYTGRAISALAGTVVKLVEHAEIADSWLVANPSHPLEREWVWAIHLIPEVSP